MQDHSPQAANNIRSAAEIVAFWRDAGPDKWFDKNAGFDAVIRARFLPTYEAAAAGKLKGWENTAEGTLALLILLDQFPRNMFRGDPRAFATDEMARAVTANGILRGFDGQAGDLRQFFYVPFEHSEDMADQETGIRLYTAAGDTEGLKWANLHADIIHRFGRFPHRNKVLGRTTTPEEQAFLDGGGFAG
ncbi:MAG: DUF924 family protein [Pseudolabrys sp.]|nr:DUF924 family protein [Pseudolabrys sp.]MBV9262547.1 DUF924 family protein [Pseudolabrys sp.]